MCVVAVDSGGQVTGALQCVCVFLLVRECESAYVFNGPGNGSWVVHMPTANKSTAWVFWFKFPISKPGLGN